MEELKSEPTRGVPHREVSTRGVVEALLFASDKPLSLKKLKDILENGSEEDLQKIIDAILEDYKDTSHGICLEKVAGGYQFRTKPVLTPWIKKLFEGKPKLLTRVQLETIAIVAYKQPITRIEVDAIRGVESSYLLKILLEKKLIRIAGVKEVVGRPLLYGTTLEFLEFFNLSDLSELPSLEQLKELRSHDKEISLFAKDTLDEKEVNELYSSNFNKSSGS